jgi:hypothetical protein
LLHCLLLTSPRFFCSLVNVVSNCQSKRRKHATPSQIRRAALLTQSELEDEGENDDSTAAAAASASRRPSRRAAAEAVQKLHAQSAVGKHRSSHSLSEERKEASANSNASEDDDSGTVRAAARSIRRRRKQHDASAAASVASSSSDNEASDAEPRSDGDDAAEASDSGSSAFSELSAVESDDELELFDEFNEPDDDVAEEWKPPADALSAVRRRRAPVRAPRWLLKIPPLRAVQRFIVDQLDAEELCGSTRAIVKHVLEILDARKSV